MEQEGWSLSRFWEVDLLRGLAVILMILFHAVFDLNYFGIRSISPTTGLLRLVGLIAALLFLLLVGASLNISYFRRISRNEDPWIRHYLARGMGIFLLGLLVTVVTYVLIREGFILFGILHCIGVSIVLAIPFFGRPAWSLIGASVCFLLGFLVEPIHGPLWYLWIGIHPETFYTLDYFPLIPWFGVVLLGLSIGAFFYPNGVRRFVRWPASSQYLAPISWLGRHSLAIYLLHQPLLLLILALIFPGSIWVIPS